MTEPFPEPTQPMSSPAEVLIAYLRFFRSRIAAKLRALPPDALRESIVPSGWTPLELVKHLTFVELRWLEWGFAGRPVDDPWGDQRDGRWHVAADESLDALLAAFAGRAARSDAIIRGHGLDERGVPGPRWSGAEPAPLERVLLHLLQEYARHAGHLDVVAELVAGTTGE